MATDVIQQYRSNNRPFSQTPWTSLSSMLMSIIQAVLLAISDTLPLAFFTRSPIIFLKTCHQRHAVARHPSAARSHLPSAARRRSPSPRRLHLVVESKDSTFATDAAQGRLNLVAESEDSTIATDVAQGRLNLVVESKDSTIDTAAQATNISTGSSLARHQRYATTRLQRHAAVRQATNVHLLGQNRASNDDDKSGAFGVSCCHTCLQYLIYKTFCLEQMMLTCMFWLVRHLPFRTAISTVIDVQVGIFCSYPPAPTLFDSLVTLHDILECINQRSVP